MIKSIFHHVLYIEDLPQLEEAYLDVNYRDVERLIGSITSVKRLTLALEVNLSVNFLLIIDLSVN